MRLSTLFLSFIAVILLSCQPSNNLKDAASDVQALIEEATANLAAQELEAAAEKALTALEAAGDDPLLQVKALQCIIGVDIMSSHDSDAWERALRAEEIARKHNFSEQLADILVSKAKLCSYAEISPETGRNDEGLEYAREALSLAENCSAVRQETEACYIIGSLYINKNRWSDPIDTTMYRTAGEWLDRGQALADKNNLDDLRRKGLLFRSRWYQQGDRNREALEVFAREREALDENDHLMASALDDRLVRLYTRVGDPQAALDIHDDYVYHITRYMTQKSDEAVANMQARFEVREKERQLELRRTQIAVLLLMVLLAVAIIIIAVNRLRRARRRNADLMRINETKEQLIELLSKDLRNPANACTSKLEQLSAEATTLSSDEIREQCRKIAQDAHSINQDVANYVSDLLIERSKRIADIGLSQREIQIIRLSAEGLTAAEIAERLFLSVHTVNTHRQRIYAKMGVKNVSDMLHSASQLGII